MVSNNEQTLAEIDSYDSCPLFAFVHMHLEMKKTKQKNRNYTISFTLRERLMTVMTN